MRFRYVDRHILKLLKIVTILTVSIGPDIGRKNFTFYSFIKCTRLFRRDLSNEKAEKNSAITKVKSLAPFFFLGRLLVALCCMEDDVLSPFVSLSLPHSYCKLPRKISIYPSQLLAETAGCQLNKKKGRQILFECFSVSSCLYVRSCVCGKLAASCSMSYVLLFPTTITFNCQACICVCVFNKSYGIVTATLKYGLLAIKTESTPCQSCQSSYGSKVREIASKARFGSASIQCNYKKFSQPLYIQ